MNHFQREEFINRVASGNTYAYIRDKEREDQDQDSEEYSDG